MAGPTGRAFEMAPSKPGKRERGCGGSGSVCGRCCPRVRDPSLFWWEKGMALLAYFQMFGLMWALSLPWPWPGRWQRWSR